jgi:serine/threonine-protein kinase
MGVVYQAYDTYRHRYVALKLLPEAFSGDQEYLRRFQRESHVAARLREPHVIPIHDFGEIGGQLFIDMRLVDGSDIGTLLDTGDRITPHRAVYLIAQVAEALDAAHADDLVHRDIKPSNILVTSNDFVYVVDFGIARSIGGRQTALTITGATIGTLQYMAPERFVGHDVDGRADVYSLACVLHECLTGAPPFTGKDLPALMYAQLYSGPPPASSLVEGLPTALDTVIARGMAKNPDDRFATAGALATAARQALLTGAVTALPPMTELQAPAWAEFQAPPLQAAPAATTWQDVAAHGPAAEPAGSRAARRFVEGATQTVSADGAGDRGGLRPPESMPQGPGPDPAGGRLPPGEATGGPAGGPARGPSRRRLGVLLLVVAAAVAVPFLIVYLASARAHPGASGPPSTGATGTGPGTTATGVAASGAPGDDLPTVAGKIAVGPNPSYIEVAPNGQFAYVTSPGTGVITVLSTATDLVSGHLKVPQGPPQFVSFSPDSRTAYVSVYSTSDSAVHLIAFVNTATSTVTSTVPVDNFTPGPSTISPDGRFLYVPNHNTALRGTDENVVDVINTATRKLIGHITVPWNPHWVAYGKNGRIYTTDHMSARVSVVNAATNSVITEITVGETPHSETLSPDGSRLAVTSFDGNEVFLINTVTDKLIATIPVGKNPVDIAYSRNGEYLYTVNNVDNSVTVIDTADNRVAGTVKTGKGPTSISLLPNGRQAYVTDDNDGTVEILSLGY